MVLNDVPGPFTNQSAFISLLVSTQSQSRPIRRALNQLAGRPTLSRVSRGCCPYARYGAVHFTKNRLIANTRKSHRVHTTNRPRSPPPPPPSPLPPSSPSHNPNPYRPLTPSYSPVPPPPEPVWRPDYIPPEVLDLINQLPDSLLYYYNSGSDPYLGDSDYLSFYLEPEE